jgi:hypothetical protein
MHKSRRGEVRSEAGKSRHGPPRADDRTSERRRTTGCRTPISSFVLGSLSRNASREWRMKMSEGHLYPRDKLSGRSLCNFQRKRDILFWCSLHISAGRLCSSSCLRSRWCMVVVPHFPNPTIPYCSSGCGSPTISPLLPRIDARGGSACCWDFCARSFLRTAASSSPRAHSGPAASAARCGSEAPCCCCCCCRCPCDARVSSPRRARVALLLTLRAGTTPPPFSFPERSPSSCVAGALIPPRSGIWTRSEYRTRPAVTAKSADISPRTTLDVRMGDRASDILPYPCRHRSCTATSGLWLGGFVARRATQTTPGRRSVRGLTVKMFAVDIFVTKFAKR